MSSTGADFVALQPAAELLRPETVLRQPNPRRKRPDWVIEAEAGQLGSIEPWNGFQGFVVRTVLLRAKEYAGAKKKAPAIHSSNDVALVCEWLLTQPQEHICVLALSNQNTLMAVHDSTAGTATSSVITGDQIARIALMVGAPAVIMVHNHPSGDPDPSKQDAEITAKVAARLHCYGVDLLDHVIMGINGRFSFRDSGLLT